MEGGEKHRARSDGEKDAPVREAVKGRVAVVGLLSRLRTKIREPIPGAKDGFFRVAFGTRDGALIFLTSKEAVTIDLNVRQSPNIHLQSLIGSEQDEVYPITPLLSLTGQTRIFTAIEKTASQRKAPCLTLCTTHEVIWIDELRPGVPALSWRHDYGGGRQRDLEISVIEAERGGT